MPAKAKSNTKGIQEKAIRKLSTRRSDVATGKGVGKAAAKSLANEKNPLAARLLDHPVFSQPQATADPTVFRVPHPSDDAVRGAVRSRAGAL